jgi:hypothetical protein
MRVTKYICENCILSLFYFIFGVGVDCVACCLGTVLGSETGVSVTEFRRLRAKAVPARLCHAAWRAGTTIARLA